MKPASLRTIPRAGPGPLRGPGAPLTDRQRAFYEQYFAILCRDGRRPSYREMMVHYGYRSTNGVMCYIQALAVKGYIRMADGTGRGGDFAILRRPDGRPFKGLTPID